MTAEDLEIKTFLIPYLYKREVKYIPIVVYKCDTMYLGYFDQEYSEEMGFGYTYIEVNYTDYRDVMPDIISAFNTMTLPKAEEKLKELVKIVIDKSLQP